jgi:hypothetical protein
MSGQLHSPGSFNHGKIFPYTNFNTMLRGLPGYCDAKRICHVIVTYFMLIVMYLLLHVPFCVYLRFSVIFPQLQGKYQGITRKNGARLVFPYFFNRIFSVICMLCTVCV